MAAVLALGATLASGNATYEERLLDFSAGKSVSREVLNITRGSPELRALFVDLSADRELHLKMLLAIEKYGDAAKEIMDLIHAANHYIEDSEPWTLAKDPAKKPKKVSPAAVVSTASTTLAGK